MPELIEDYALIGDLATAALVGKSGSIDWFCTPRFDSQACFTALLGGPDNGRWQVAPASQYAVKRRYREDSLVLETQFETAEGVVTLIDCMPVQQPGHSENVIVRQVVGESGAVAMHMEIMLRFDYGRTVPWVRRSEGGFRAIAGPLAVELFSSVPLNATNFRHVADFTVEKGDRVSFVLTSQGFADASPPGFDVAEAIQATEKWWKDWASKCNCKSEWREAIVRSLITLKALSHAKTGGIVAAATTSLPEEIGGTRNWDYRYCWIRDATFTLYSLLMAGLSEEAQAWRDWLLRVAAGKPSQLQTLYGADGERMLPEVKVDWLSGYENSAPVRIGNLAARQLQIDIYGEVMDVFHTSRLNGITDTEDSWALQQALIEFLETGWRKPDNSIWEVRGPRRHFTHSKVLAWVALDRAVKGVESFGLEGPVEKWRSVRDEIHREVCRRGYDAEKKAFVQSFGSSTLDAALLQIPLVGFLPATDERVKGTVEAISRELSHDGFIHRYKTETGVDGLSGGEGVFLPCTFWLADNYATQGRCEEAREIFAKLLAIRNDVGLLSEEYDPANGRFLGNFPQAFTHVSLVNTAWHIDKAEENLKAGLSTETVPLRTDSKASRTRS